MNQELQFLLLVGVFGLLILLLLLMAAKGVMAHRYNAQMDAHQRQEAINRTARRNDHGD
jgi:O-antigen ligase